MSTPSGVHTKGLILREWNTVRLLHCPLQHSIHVPACWAELFSQVGQTLWSRRSDLATCPSRAAKPKEVRYCTGARIWNHYLSEVCVPVFCTRNIESPVLILSNE